VRPASFAAWPATGGALAEGAVEQEPLADRFGFNGLITLSVNVVLKLTNSELLISNYAFDEIAN